MSEILVNTLAAIGIFAIIAVNAFVLV